MSSKTNPANPQASGAEGVSSSAVEQPIQIGPPFLPPAPPIINGKPITPTAPDEARKVIEARPLPPNIYRPKTSTKIVLAAVAGDASNTVEGPASIVELARALKNDVDLIFEWVYNNVDFITTYGLQKGGLGALIDRQGNSFDQSDLLVQLLRQAGYTASYELGQIEITAAQADAWLGTNSTGIFPPAYYLAAYGGIPVSWRWDGTQYWLTFSHMWVKVNIGGTNYLFDPTFKTYTTVSGINMATATGYVAATYKSDAESGSTQTADYIQNVNRTNLRADLTTYSNSLVSWIKANKPDATVDDIIGGRTINPVVGPIRNLTLSYEKAGDVPTEYTMAIPDTYKAALNVQYDSDINVSFFSPDIHTKRLTFFANSSVPTQLELRLDGTLIATTTVGTGYNIYLNATHPYPTNFADQGTQHVVGDNTSLLVAQAWGPTGRGLMNTHKKSADLNTAAGGAPGSEPIVGENIAVIWAMYTAENSRMADLLGRMTSVSTLFHHFLGVCYYFTQPTQLLNFDLPGINPFVVGLSASSDTFACGVAWGIHGYGLEQLAIQQGSNDGNTAVCAATVIDAAVAAGQRIYALTNSNYVAAETNMTFYSDEQSYINTFVGTSTVLAPQNCPITVNTFSGYGFEAFPTTGGSYGIIRNTKGGIGYYIPSAWLKRPCDQGGGGYVEPFTGHHKQKVTDISLSCLPYPFGLRLDRYYNSELRLRDSEVGLGWRHSFDITNFLQSDGLKGMGEDTAISGVASLVEMYVALDILSDHTEPFDKLVILSLGVSWWIEQMSQNCVAVATAGGSELFVKLPDGSYNPPIGGANTLVLNGDGTFTRKTPQKVALNFNSSGQVSTIVYPAGVTITFTYVSGLLSTVSNGMGRTLTFHYTGTRLTSVSDGNGRSVSYLVDTNGQLTQFTDANGKLTTFSYDITGRLTQVFLPAHPTTAVLTNVYDSLDRIKSQSDALSNQWTFYLAGSRAEIVDPISNKTVLYYNRFGSVIRAINALGFETDYQYDGLNRATKVTLPEGNYFQYVYDANNNLLSKTAVAKSGSGLSNITNVFTYDATWNKVHTAQDGNLNTTTFNWDATQGTLLSIVRPVVGGQTPQVTCTYNSRGQILTITDETGIVTKLNYDTTTEELLSAVADYGISPHLNITTQFGYTAWGDVNSVTDPLGNITTATVDVLDRVTQITAPTPFSYISNLGYDDNSNLTSAQSQTSDPMNPWQIYGNSYTLNDQLQTITDPVTNPLNLTYDTADRLGTVKDAENRTNTLAYDALNRLYTDTDPSNTIDDTRTYTNNGLLASFKDVRNNTTQFTYDGFDRLNKTIYPDTTFEQNSSYDANGNVLTALTRSGNSIVMTYDVLNRLSTKAPTGQPTVTLTYDLAGRLIKANKPVVSGDPSTGDFQLFFDTAGRFYQEQYPDSKAFTHVLDANGNVTKTTWPDGYYVTRVYDQLNRLTDIKLNGASTAAAHFDYDKLSRRTALTLGNGVVTSYSYALDDNLTSLAHAFVGSNLTFTCGQNKVHQLTSQGVSDVAYLWHPAAPGTTSYGTADSVNEYPTVGGTTYSYDGNKNLSGDGTWTFTFDTENHLLTASKTGTSASFLYDPLQRQAQKTVGTAKTRYLYAGWQRLADYDGVAGTLQNRYVYGIGLDEPLIVVSSAGVVSYLHADQIGSIIAQTNSSGSVTNKATYSAFGESSGPPGTTFGFTGQRFDSETGLYYYKNRYLSPTIGRFLQPDPIGYSGGRNLYAYVENDPLNSTDPLGLDTLQGGVSTAQGIGGAGVAPDGGFIAPPGGSLFGPVDSGFNGIPNPNKGSCSQCEESGDDLNQETAQMDSGSSGGGGNPNTGPYSGGVSAATNEIFENLRAFAGTYGPDRYDLLITVNANKPDVLFSAGMGGAAYSLTPFLAGGVAGGSRGAGLDFSHWIPNRMGGPRNLLNGNFVGREVHALSDPFRYRFMKRAWKNDYKMWAKPIQQLVRVPLVIWGGIVGNIYGIWVNQTTKPQGRS